MVGWGKDDSKEQEAKENGYAWWLKLISKTIFFIVLVGAPAAWITMMIIGQSEYSWAVLLGSVYLMIPALIIGGFGEIISLLQKIYNELKHQNKEG